MLHHVSLEVAPDQADALTGFFGLVGFEPIANPDALGDAVVWLQAGPTQIHLIRTEGASVPVLGHVALVTPDFEQAIERLESAGHTVERARELWGQPRAFALGPGGHRVELMAAPPG